MIFKPSIFDAKYDKMTYEERAVAFDRDRMLYEQTEALNRIANQFNNNSTTSYDDHIPENELEAHKIILDAKYDGVDNIENQEILILANNIEYWTKVKDNTLILLLLYISLVVLAGMAMLFVRYSITKFIVIIAGVFLTSLYLVAKSKLNYLYNKIVEMKNRE